MELYTRFCQSNFFALSFIALSFTFVIAVLCSHFYVIETKALIKQSKIIKSSEIKFQPAVALATLREQALSSPELMVGCHNEAHKIGHKAYTEFREQAFFFVDPMCGGGYLHGVLEEAFFHNGLVYLDRVVHDQCNGEILESCLHGVGHGLHHLIKDTQTSIEVCASISGSSTDCYDGVYMDEFDTEGNLDIAPPPLESATLVCEEAPEDAKSSCYFYLPRVLSEQNPDATIELCSKKLINEGWAACANGSGVYFMKHTSNFDRKTAEILCELYSDSNLRLLCLRGVLDYAEYGAADNSRWH